MAEKIPLAVRRTIGDTTALEEFSASDTLPSGNLPTIPLNKLAALTASRALVTSGAGIIEASAATAAELGYLSGVTSSVQTQLNGKEPSITSGTAAQYWRGDKTWVDFFTDVRAATLTGLSTATNAVITAADTVLGSLGKLQAQFTAHFSNTSNPHSTTAAQVGAPTTSGTGATGTWGIAISGNAATATSVVGETSSATPSTVVKRDASGGFLAGVIKHSPQAIARILTASDSAASDQFGRAVTLSADASVLAVGAISWEGSATDQGGVYIYDWNGSAWVQRGAVLTASDAAASDYFGTSVTLSADASVLAVGALLWEGSFSNQGGVYIFDWNGSAWVQRGAVLTASDSAASDRFGTSVTLSADGSVLAVGTYLWEGSATDQGGVYIYDWSGSAWIQRGSVLTASDAAVNDNFGTSVALSADGSVLAVGANLWEGSAANQGGVYIFDWNGSAWVQRGAVLTASDAAASDYFGISAALSADGGVLAVGTYLWEGSFSNQGGVYTYSLTGALPASRATSNGDGWLDAVGKVAGQTIVTLTSTGLTGTLNPSSLTVAADTFRLTTARTPASASASGNTGDMCWDASYFYICTATNTWRRIAHSTW